jgi:hypothetical protein
MYLASIAYMANRWWEIGDAFLYNADTMQATLDRLDFGAPNGSIVIRVLMAGIMILTADCIMVG